MRYNNHHIVIVYRILCQRKDMVIIMKSKKLLRVLCLALCLILTAVCFAGCNSEKTSSGGDKGTSANSVDASQFEGVNLIMFCAADEEETIKEVAKAAGDKWEKDTGGKITYVMNPDWNQRYTNLTVKLATGQQLDGYCSTTQDCPTLPLKGLFLPVDEYLEETDYVSKHLSEQAYGFEGKTYGFAQKCRSVPFVILYNKTLFENNGVKTPTEYYEEGNWTWDTFREVAKEMTMDLNNDGQTDQYGFGTWYAHPFLCSAGLADYIDSDGKVTLNNPLFTETMQFLQTLGFEDKSYVTNGGSFTEGSLAMTAERTYYVQQYKINGLEDEVDFVPFPLSSKNTGDTRYMYWVDGLSILSNTVNADATAFFLKNYWAVAYDEWFENYQFTNEYWDGGYTNEQKEIIEEMTKYSVCMPSQGYPNFTTTVSDGLLKDIVTKGLSASSSIATYSSKLQAIVDDAIAAANAEK